MKVYQKIVAAIFTISLFAFSAYNFLTMKGFITSEIKELEKPETVKEMKYYTASIDSGLSSNMVFGHFWNEAYGAIYSFIGKNEENSFKYVRDKNGFLFTANFWNYPDVEAREYARRVKRIQDKLADRDTKVIFLLCPTQYNEAWSDGYYGIPYQDYNEYGDKLIRWLRYYNIDYIDYKEYYLEENKSEEDIFYKTDHHWTVPAAFEGFTLLVNHLNEKYDEDLDEFYTDINNYNVDEYKDAFIGSQGREAGVAYTGLDDYTMIVPKFETDYDYQFKPTSSADEFQHLSGNILKTLIRKNYYYKDDYYEKDMNNSYLDGIYLYDKIQNKLNKNGIKALFLRDSYASPLATFFSSYCSEMDLVWSARADSKEVEELMNNETYDYVFVAMAVDSVVSGAIPYCASEVETTDE